MKWHTKYLSVFEKEFEEVSPNIINEIKNKIKQIQCEKPLVSVVLIAHNEEKRILSCLWSLSDNICSESLEIICVDNASTDKTPIILDKLNIVTFKETKKGPGHARQCGLDHAKGKYLLCIDSDTMYPPYYIQTMINQLIKEEVAGVYSLWSFVTNNNKTSYCLYIYEFLRDLHLLFQSIKRPELCVRGMAFGFNTEFARKIGFRTDIIRGEDGSMALELKKFGKLLFLKSRRARVLTSNETIRKDGSLAMSFKKRIIKHIKELSGYFSEKKRYKDEESNLL